MKILNFGSCNIDYVYSIEHIVRTGETETTDKLEVFPGGKGLNQSVAIARAGTKVYHAGCIGNDAEILLDTFKSSGVDTSYLKQADAKNGHAIIQVSSQGENSIFLHPGSNHMITNDFTDEVLGGFEKGDIILLQNEINNIEYIVDRAWEKGMVIVLNPSPFDEKLKRLDFNKIAYLILNETEGCEITGESSAEKILLHLKNSYPELKVVLTLGEKGCVYMDKNSGYYQPIFKTKVVDTTAAGDTFTGYFISEISKGTQYKDAIKIASCASAVTVSGKGAAPSIPTEGEVLKALNCLREEQ